MAGYVTVGLILCLGGYGALLLACRAREEGVVVRRVHPLDGYLRAVAAAARAALAVQQAYVNALRQHGAALTAELRAALGRDDIHAVYEVRDLLEDG